jgi:hypothetical protein
MYLNIWYFGVPALSLLTAATTLQVQPVKIPFSNSQ